ncbi:MAG: thymidine phosphorylase [Armatimonadota bacterium]|jgi:pyrimidine-nucleoside phosphorylase
MTIPDIIAAKRDGLELSGEDIRRLVLGYTAGEIADYQMSAFLMAAYIRGLNFAETAELTSAMVDSGNALDLSKIKGIKVDKHSTGGVGDKTTLVIVPMLAACGLKVPKMSGRGLGFTGGTVDKLESIPGFNTSLSLNGFIKQINKIGAAIAGQTADMAPADKMIYALRDVTATVDSIPLISASIMSKKIACGADVILLDVKVGNGAFMKDLDDARELAGTMISIGRNLNRKVGAIITDMNQPLGRAVGNSLEVREAIDTLSGHGPADLTQLCIELCAAVLNLSDPECCIETARSLAKNALFSGAALGKFGQIIRAQGGDADVVYNPALMGEARIIKDVTAESAGVVSEIDTAGVGKAASALGAGRQRKEDRIDPVAGVVVEKKIGDKVEIGDTIATIHGSDESKIHQAEEIIKGCYLLADSAHVPPLIVERM